MQGANRETAICTKEAFSRGELIKRGNDEQASF
jgi:hypothetical protein